MLACPDFPIIARVEWNTWIINEADSWEVERWRVVEVKVSWSERWCWYLQSVRWSGFVRDYVWVVLEDTWKVRDDADICKVRDEVAEWEMTFGFCWMILAKGEMMLIFGKWEMKWMSERWRFGSAGWYLESGRWRSGWYKQSARKSSKVRDDADIYKVRDEVDKWEITFDLCWMIVPKWEKMLLVKWETMWKARVGAA